jgi:hypothetical protein
MRRTVLGLALLLAAVVSLASCGASSGGMPSPMTASPQLQASPSGVHGPSGVYGIAVVPEQGGYVGTVPPPSALPGGFGRSYFYPRPHATIVVKATAGEAARVVTNVVANAEGIFRVALPPGNYIVFAKGGYYLRRSAVTVRHDAYTRVVVWTFQ